jgi:phenylacetate-CoA ligase
MKARGLTPNDIRTTDDLEKLPMLDKQTLRDNWKSLVSDEVDPDRVPVRRTGGTTGEPLGIPRDPQNDAYENGAFLRGLGFGKYQQGETLVKLFGGTLGLAPESFCGHVKTWFSGELFLPAFELSQQNVARYIEAIQRSNAGYLRGYASAVYLLSRLVAEAGLKLRLQAVFPTAETLYDHQREAIEKNLGEVFEYYGCGEVNSVAFECEAHEGLHVSEEHVVFELLREGETTQEGTMGAVTLTTLQNYNMPLIRYQNGDVAIRASHPCPCGRGLGRLARILGRTNDLLRAQDGRLISGAFIPHLFRTTQGIQEVQVIQEREDLLLVKVVKGLEFTAREMELMLEIIQRYLGEVTIRVEYVDCIPTTAMGKLRFVISKVVDRI